MTFSSPPVSNLGTGCHTNWTALEYLSEPTNAQPLTTDTALESGYRMVRKADELESEFTLPLHTMGNCGWHVV